MLVSDEREAGNANHQRPRLKIIRYERPYCPVHGVLMVCKSSPESVRYFYCPCSDCGESRVITKKEQDV